MTDPSLRIDYDPFGTGAKRGRGRGGDRKGDRRGKGRSWIRRWSVRLLLLTGALVLPSLVMVRASVEYYRRWGGDGWAAVGAAALTTTVVWIVYAWVVRVRVQGRFTVPRAVIGTIAAAVLVYVVYLLVYLSSANAKTPQVRDEFTAVHPVLRVTLSTILLVDRGALVTDAARTIEDYDRWGLPRAESSLHFEQSDGFVHAFDLRTRGRPEVWNHVVAVYFQLAGLRTLRHVGTADHLHVSLPVSR